MKRNQFLVRKIEMNQNVRWLLGMQCGEVIAVRCVEGQFDRGVVALGVFGLSWL